MELVVLPSAEAVAVRAAEMIARLLAAKPEAVLGLPAGGTPRPVYAELVRRHRTEGLSFARATGFGLDEYVGLPADHPASFRRYLDGVLFDHVDLPRARAYAPEGTAADLAAAARGYEAAIAAAGGFDLVLLGIGGNGHVAFNEPGSPVDSRTRVVTLAAETRAANQPAFGAEPVPERAITVGLATILSSRLCLLMACGPHKAAAIAATIEAPTTTRVPASALQRHQHAIVVVDEEAAAALSPGRPRSA